MATLTAVVKEPGKLVVESPELVAGDEVTLTIRKAVRPNSEESRHDVADLLEEIRQHMKERPQDFRTPAQIDADIKAERDSWD
ncbi:hypothetical protein EON79_02715 [bacterium]|nr:MAG: hypothetical protein EON79_02715 [bacterium]